MKNLEENNKLIAEFMMFETVGDLHLIPFDNTANDTYLPEHMKFHSSWDWLMPVVEKIANDTQKIIIDPVEEGVKIHIFKNGTNEVLREIHNHNGLLIDCLYLSVVEFIKWHNETANSLDGTLCRNGKLIDKCNCC